jgi:hypothetical protein
MSCTARKMRIAAVRPATEPGGRPMAMAASAISASAISTRLRTRNTMRPMPSPDGDIDSWGAEFEGRLQEGYREHHAEPDEDGGGRYGGWCGVQKCSYWGRRRSLGGRPGSDSRDEFRGRGNDHHDGGFGT